jgi:UDP-N-acetylglucosamine 2-epimerase (non-hydrolysing)
MPMTDLLVVAGARPNFMKAAPLLEAAGRAGLSCALVHTGQHYDAELSDVFFAELGLPEPDAHLGVGSGTHAEQTARIMTAFEPELRRFDPAVVVVVGDVNSTLACSLVAAKEHYPIAHVEAGLRCHDFFMAEEINRRLCDHLSTYLFTTSRDARDNLVVEGIPDERIEFVGNTMIDTLLRSAEAARSRGVAERLGLSARYAILTLHRPENVDDERILTGLLEAVEEISREIPVVFPLHPRTAARIEAFGLGRHLDASGIHVCASLGYLDFLGLLAGAALALTDSGGVQEEATVLGIPCVTLRESTERPVTVEQGTNVVVGTKRDAVLEAARAAIRGERRPGQIPELWDGRAGERIAARLAEEVFELEGTATANA